MDSLGALYVKILNEIQFYIPDYSDPLKKKMLASQKILLQLSFSETCWIYRACERPAEVLILLFIRRELRMFLTLGEKQVEV